MEKSGSIWPNNGTVYDSSSVVFRKVSNLILVQQNRRLQTQQKLWIFSQTA